MSKKFSKEPEKFGTGHIEGIVESGSANNSALAGAWIPALVFGIPGDTITAIVIGVLYMKNMNPGPTLFTTNPQNIYAVFLLFIIANIIMVPLGILCIKVAKRILRVPREVLMPLILLFCIVGTFAINNSMFEVGVMLVAAKPIGEFVVRHPSVKVLALAFLIMVGMALTAEAFDVHVPKGYIYAAMAFSLAVEALNIRARAKRRRLQAGG